MKYLIINDSESTPLGDEQNLVKVFIEINDAGHVRREIGFDMANQIVHAYPSKNYRYGGYGIFDLVMFDTSSWESNLSKEEFEKRWENI